jgi:hypothetical protein
MVLSRCALFEMVWSEPRSTLSKRFGVSDVALAKKCRLANIPMPPRGYWAKVEAGQQQQRLPLPLRTPGQADTIAFESRELAPPAGPQGHPQPHVYQESIEVLVDAACTSLGRVRPQRDLTEPYSGLARLLRKEAGRRAQYEGSAQWSYYKPHFDDPVSQRQLRLYSALFRAFDQLGVKGHVSEESKWVQGIGTSYGLSGGLDFGGSFVRFEFTLTKGGKNAGQALSLELATNSATDFSEKFRWSDADGHPLEKQLTEIAKGLMTRAEVALRAHSERVYKWEMEKIERARAEEADRLRAQQAEREARANREEAAKRRSLYRLVHRRELSMDVRALVDALKAGRPDLAGVEHFEQWCQFALAEADRIDPLRADLDELLGSTGTAATMPSLAPS